MKQTNEKATGSSKGWAFKSNLVELPLVKE